MARQFADTIAKGVAGVGTSWTDAYALTVNRQASVTRINVCNVTSSVVKLSIRVTKNSVTTNEIIDKPIAPNEPYNHDGTITLRYTGDKIEIKSDTAASLDVSCDGVEYV